MSQNKNQQEGKASLGGAQGDFSFSILATHASSLVQLTRRVFLMNMVEKCNNDASES